MKILAIIPARGGSKSIPQKNIVSVAGQPLISWTIKSSLKSKLIDKTVVSSDNQKILSIAVKHGAEIIKRPKNLATDKASPEAVIKQVLDDLSKKENYLPDAIIYLQPTSPLRTTQDINQAIKIFLQKKANAVTSVYEIDNKMLKSFTLEKNGFIKPINKHYPSMNRQELPKTLMANGAIYLIKRKVFLKTKTLHPNKTLPYIMSQEKSIDLDTLAELKIIKKLINK